MILIGTCICISFFSPNDLVYHEYTYNLAQSYHLGWQASHSVEKMLQYQQLEDISYMHNVF